MLFHLVRPLLLAVLVLLLAACGKSTSGNAAASGSNPETGMIIKNVTAGIFSPDMPGWAKKYSCNSCHTIDKKLVGPAWIDVARKYKGDGDAAARLSDKITRGGGGVWGAMPMPPNSQVSDAEKKEMVRFILGLAK